MYPVVDGRLRCHPGLCDPIETSGDMCVLEGESLSYCSGSLNPRTVAPSGNVEFAFRKAVRTVQDEVRQHRHHLFNRRMAWNLTLLLWVSIGVVETPGLRRKIAQIGIGRVVFPGSPVGGPRDLATQRSHARVPIRVDNSTTAHDASCAFGGAMVVGMAMWLRVEGGKQRGNSKKD